MGLLTPGDMTNGIDGDADATKWGGLAAQSHLTRQRRAARSAEFQAFVSEQLARIQGLLAQQHDLELARLEAAHDGTVQSLLTEVASLRGLLANTSAGDSGASGIASRSEGSRQSDSTLISEETSPVKDVKDIHRREMGERTRVHNGRETHNGSHEHEHCIRDELAPELVSQPPPHPPGQSSHLSAQSPLQRVLPSAQPPSFGGLSPVQSLQGSRTRSPPPVLPRASEAGGGWKDSPASRATSVDPKEVLADFREEEDVEKASDGKAKMGTDVTNLLAATSSQQKVPMESAVDEDGASCGVWSCSACTLNNELGAHECAACGGPSPPRQAPPPPATTMTAPSPPPLPPPVSSVKSEIEAPQNAEADSSDESGISKAASLSDRRTRDVDESGTFLDSSRGANGSGGDPSGNTSACWNRSHGNTSNEGYPHAREREQTGSYRNVGFGGGEPRNVSAGGVYVNGGYASSGSLTSFAGGTPGSGSLADGSTSSRSRLPRCSRWTVLDSVPPPSAIGSPSRYSVPATPSSRVPQQTPPSSHRMQTPKSNRPRTSERAPSWRQQGDHFPQRAPSCSRSPSTSHVGHSRSPSPLFPSSAPNAPYTRPKPMPLSIHSPSDGASRPSSQMMHQERKHTRSSCQGPPIACAHDAPPGGGGNWWSDNASLGCLDGHRASVEEPRRARRR